MGQQHLNENPSDFGDFVYCGFKWLYGKNEALKRKPPVRFSKKYANRLIGQKNENLCVEKVLSELNLSQDDILFNGTDDSYTFLTAYFPNQKRKINCKPDLIVRKGKEIILFEFKAMSDIFYTILSPLDSVLAQVWCYTKLDEVKIDKYFLMKYYLDPIENPTVITELTANELDNLKFEDLFENYLTVVDTLNHITKSNSRNLNSSVLLELQENLNMPNNDVDKKIKCSNCYLKKQKICPNWMS